MSDQYSEYRRAARDEYKSQQAVEEFWTSLYREYPLIRGHQELARNMLHRMQAKIADMTILEGRRHLGEAVTKEIERRLRRDEQSQEARAYGPGPFGNNGHSFDPTTGETVEGSDEYDHEPRTFSDIVRERRAQRRAASLKYHDKDIDRDTKRRRGAYAG